MRSITGLKISPFHGRADFLSSFAAITDHYRGHRTVEATNDDKFETTGWGYTGLGRLA
jgi:hypothetical protein